VAANLRLFHPLIVDMVQARWTRHVSCIAANRLVLGRSVDLREFLFGTGREPLAVFRPLLRELQSGACFYCGRGVRGPGDVDHFVPWSRYPVDLGHNFVLAHADCNRRKRDYLAAEEHLAKWLRRNGEHSRVLDTFFRQHGVVGDLPGSTQVARWAYEQAEASGAHVWVGGDDVRPIGRSWRGLFGGDDDPGMLMAAEKG
jgi:5-methylcytosine-specific restriction endonuclease McrA